MAKIGSHELPTRTLLLVAVDIVAIVFALVTAAAVRLYATFPYNAKQGAFWVKVALVATVCALALHLNDLYDFRVVRRRASLLLHMIQALGWSCLVLALIYFAAPMLSLGRGIAGSAVPLILIFLLSWRLSANATNMLASGDERLLVMGTGENGVALVRHILAHPEYNIKVIGFLDERGLDIGKSLVNPRIIGSTEDVQSIVARERVDHVVLSLKERRGATPIRQLLDLKFAGVGIEDVHQCFERLSGRITLEHLSPSWLILSDGFKKSSILLAAKRGTDILVSAILLLIVLPLLPFIALAIYLDSGSPLLFRQKRVGYKGKEFELLKFRSMVQNAERNGPQWATRQDSRITRVGRFLRKTRLDEIPQLFNVFRGEMSLVGPRPERRHFCDMLEKEIPYYDLRHSVRPGLTGWAQVRFRYGASLEEAKGKLELDFFYLKNMSFFVDMAILFETAKIVILRRGAQ